MLIWEIENTGNVPIYFKSGTCEVVDANGGLIDIFQNVNVYPSIADPGECVYYYTTESFDIDEYTRAGMDDILIKPDGDIAKNENIRYDVTDVTLRDEEYFGIKAIGRVENNTSETGNLVTVAVVLFDSSDKPIGVLTDILTDELTPGRQVSFEASDLILPDDLTAASVDHYEAFAYPLQYQF
jgi:hypothetical protein